MGDVLADHSSAGVPDTGSTKVFGPPEVISADQQRLLTLAQKPAEVIDIRASGSPTRQESFTELNHQRDSFGVEQIECLSQPEESFVTRGEDTQKLHVAEGRNYVGGVAHDGSQITIPRRQTWARDAVPDLLLGTLRNLRWPGGPATGVAGSIPVFRSRSGSAVVIRLISRITEEGRR